MRQNFPTQGSPSGQKSGSAWREAPERTEVRALSRIVESALHQTPAAENGLDTSMDLPEKRAVVVMMARMPEPGRVKTRLAADIGCDAAALLYRAFVEDLVERLHATWPLVLGGDPAWPLTAYGRWLPDLHAVWGQGDGDLGARMARLLQRAFDEGWSSAVLIGSDVPHLPSSFLDEAVARLEAGADIVLGPSADGGYYLVAMRRRWPVFDGIEWSTPRVLEQTLARAAELGARVEHLHVETDVDDGSDLSQVARRIEGGDLDSVAMPRTRELVTRLEEFSP